MARCKGAKVMKSRISSLFGLGLLLGVASSGIAAEVPHVFQPGQVIESSKMNENFAFLAQSGVGKRAEYNIDCSSGTNLLTETIAGASATEIDITISGVCVEDHLKFDAYTGVRILGDDSAAVDADILEISFALVGLEVRASVGFLTVTRGAIEANLPFRSKAQTSRTAEFLDRDPNNLSGLPRIFGQGNAYIGLGDYGCEGGLDDFGSIAVYSHSRAGIFLKESCGSTGLFAGSLSRMSLRRDAGASFSTSQPTIIRVRENASFILEGEEFSYPTNESGDQVQEPTGIPPESISMQSRNATVSVVNVCLAGPNILTSSLGHFSPASSCPDGSQLTLNNGSHITSGPSWENVNVSSSSSYEGEVHNDVRGFFANPTCADCSVQ